MARALGRYVSPCVVAVGVVSAVLLAGVAWGAPQETTEALARRVARLDAENAALEKLVALAAGREFYLVLDPTVPDLTLMLRGAELRRYPVLGLAVGEPRVAFWRRRARGAWVGVVFEHGELDPPRAIDRLEITAPPPSPPGGGEDRGAGGGAPAVIPPPPEEAYPVPLRYHIRFRRGPAVEIRPREADPSSRWARLATWWSARWRDAVAAVRPPAAVLVRLRVVLAPADAEALYRSLPPDVKLLVQPQASALIQAAR
jgi:hypothetical protein